MVLEQIRDVVQGMGAPELQPTSNQQVACPHSGIQFPSPFIPRLRTGLSFVKDSLRELRSGQAQGSGSTHSRAALKLYAQLVDIPPQKLTLQTLRHSATCLCARTRSLV